MTYRKLNKQSNKREYKEFDNGEIECVEVIYLILYNFKLIDLI